MDISIKGIFVCFFQLNLHSKGRCQKLKFKTSTTVIPKLTILRKWLDTKLYVYIPILI